MDIIITGRNDGITGRMKDYATEKLEKLGSEFPRVMRAHVILEIEKYRHIVEMVLTGPRVNVQGRAESTDMLSSIDAAVDKVERRLAKAKGKIRDKKQRGGPPPPPAEAEEEE